MSDDSEKTSLLRQIAALEEVILFETELIGSHIESEDFDEIETLAKSILERCETRKSKINKHESRHG